MPCRVTCGEDDRSCNETKFGDAIYITCIKEIK